MAEFSMPAGIQLGPVHLVVSDLDRATAFYGRVLGLQATPQQRGERQLTAGDSPPLLRLTGQPDARPKPPGTTGLYHFAVLLPSRSVLAALLAHMAETGYPIQGASDHRVSEAVYLEDPDGNGIEMYADRPRDQWPKRDGEIAMATDPLDMEGLMEELEEDHPWDGLPSHTRVGHIHLQVPDIVLAEAYYRDFLGFDLVTRYGSRAVFLSAGGYHHHIGLNSWAGKGAPPPPPDAVGLRSFTIHLPDAGQIEELAAHASRMKVPFAREEGAIRLKDPFGNGITIDAL